MAKITRFAQEWNPNRFEWTQSDWMRMTNVPIFLVM